MTMTNNPIDNELAASENIIEIDLIHKITGTTLPKVAVYGHNSMSDVLDVYAQDIGVNPNDSRIIFTNKRTGQSTSDSAMTIAGFGLCNGDVLLIADNGGVAADEDDPIEIDLAHKITGATYPKAAVYPNNTLAQILAEYAGDIGVNPNDSKVIFTNKRTGQATSDSAMTIAEFGLCNGDVLLIADNGGVAAHR